QQAGEVAAARFANEAAVDYLSRALKLVPGDDLATDYDLLLAREQVYALQGARETEAQDIAALEALAGRLGDDRRRAEVALRRAAYTHDTGAYGEAVAAAAQACAWATAAGDVGLVAESYYLGGTPLVFAGQYG